VSKTKSNTPRYGPLSHPRVAGHTPTDARVGTTCPDQILGSHSSARGGGRSIPSISRGMNDDYDRVFWIRRCV
jgi:hypothetical protein